ncbi:MAG: hypothetical protein WC869_14045 [Phycisphaerae bacterium]|jgi:hypothetical protein
MSFDFSSIADDFFVNMNLQTTLALPTSRETVLQFCEAVQKEFRTMTSFYQRETGEYVLESDHEEGSYLWMEMQNHRLSAGYFNPPTLADAYKFHSWLLERSVYFLGVSGLDVDCLDILFGFNLDFRGNRDAVAARALLEGSPLAALVSGGGMKAIEFEPSLVLALEDACYLQARVTLETRSSSYQVRMAAYEEEPISIYFTLRQYPRPGKVMNVREALDQQYSTGEDMVVRLVIPNIVQPIAAAIATAE